MNDIAKTPKVRFPGFEGEWPERRLDEFMTFKNGVNADKSMYGTGRKYISVLDIIADGPITYDTIIGRVNISLVEFEKNKVQCGDILFQRSSETREEAGQSNIYLDRREEATFGGFVIRGRAIAEYDCEYFDALLKTRTARKDITSRSGGSTRFNIGQESLAAVVVNVAPTLAEQKKIAVFIKVVNENLGALRKKLDLLASYKRGVMQRLFSQTIRFKSDDGTSFPPWRTKLLEEIFEWVRTNSLSRESLTDSGGQVQNIHYGDIHTKFKANFRQSAEAIPFIVRSAMPKQIPDVEYCRPGDVVIADASEDYADIGKAIEIIEVRPRSLVAGLHTYIARPKTTEIALGFNGYLWRSAPTRRQIVRIAQGISVLGISKTNLEKLIFRLPHPDEQQKIANFLSSLDAMIDTVARQVIQTEAFKNALLQQMFV